jgi:lysyl-tRNA synthetase class 2
VPHIGNRVIRLERHEKGPRLFVAGRRLHECHAGVAVLGLAIVLHLLHFGDRQVPTGVVAMIAVLGAYMIIKDARDFVPRWRDTASWSVGIHRREFALRPPRPASWAPIVIGVLVMLAGFANIIAAIRPELQTRSGAVNTLLSEGVRGSIHAAALPLGLFLVVTGTYLIRRRHGAWMFALALLVITVPVALLHRDVDGAVVAFSLAITLAVTGNAFTVRRDPHALRAAVLRVPIIGGIAVVTAVGTILAAYRHVTPRLTTSRLVTETVDLMTFQNGPLTFGTHAHWVPLGIGLVSVAAIVAAAAPLLRPLRHPRQPAGDSVREHAHGLVSQYGDDSLSFFKLRKDLHYLFTSDRRAFLGYRVRRGVLVVSGDPVGPADAMPEIVGDLFRFAESHGLRVAAIGASATMATIYREAGMRAIYIGDEAIVDTRTFSLEGRPIRKVRQSVTRIERAGYSLSVDRMGDISCDDLAALDRISERWRAGAPERGFSMTVDELGGFGQDESRVIVARDAEGAPRGFLHLVPCAGRPALSLSLMRRDPDTPNGLVEFMIARGIGELRGQGIDEISLNFVTFGRVLREPRTVAHRALRRILIHFDRWFQINRLQQFNAKFFPRWVPRYMMVDGWASAPRSAYAVMDLEGQLPQLPHGRLRRHKGHGTRSTGTATGPA